MLFLYELHAAVLGAAFLGAVVGDRNFRALSDSSQTVGGDALSHECGHNSIGALLAETVVDSGGTETTDAVSFIVSEETGVISMAKEGKITRYLDVKTLTRMLTELLAGGSKLPGISGKKSGAAESEGGKQ